MTDERFNALVNGPLSHPMPLFTITRMALALREVVNETGLVGERALERHCRAREWKDLRDGDCCPCAPAVASVGCRCRCHELAKAATQ